MADVVRAEMNNGAHCTPSRHLFIRQLINPFGEINTYTIVEGTFATTTTTRTMTLDQPTLYDLNLVLHPQPG